MGVKIYGNLGLLLDAISLIFFIVNIFMVALSPLILYFLFQVLGLVFPIGAIILGYVGILKDDSRELNTNLGRSKLTRNVISMGICLFILEMFILLVMRCSIRSC